MGTTRAESSKEQVKMSARARRTSSGFREQAHYPLAATLADIPSDASGSPATGHEASISRSFNQAVLSWTACGKARFVDRRLGAAIVR